MAAEKLLRDETLGTLGTLLSAKATLYMGLNRRLANVLWDDGTHIVDALMFLTGGVPRLEKHWGAELSSRSGTAWFAGRIQSAGKKESIPFVLEAGAGRDHLVFEIEFSSERGRLRIGNGIFEVWDSEASPYAENFRSLKKTKEGFDGPTGYFTNMAADAAACVKNPALSPRSTAAGGLSVIEYLHSLES
jgi:predicted dehydrogenase